MNITVHSKCLGLMFEQLTGSMAMFGGKMLCDFNNKKSKMQNEISGTELIKIRSWEVQDRA